MAGYKNSNYIMSKKLVAKVFAKILSIRTSYLLSQFAEKGHNIFLGHSADLILAHIHCGHHVYIGLHASFMASIAHIFIGDYVIYGSNMTIRGGASYRHYWKTHL